VRERGTGKVLAMKTLRQANQRSCMCMHGC
jgi:hypothetical protein